MDRRPGSGTPGASQPEAPSDDMKGPTPRLHSSSSMATNAIKKQGMLRESFTSGSLHLIPHLHLSLVCDFHCVTIQRCLTELCWICVMFSTLSLTYWLQDTQVHTHLPHLASVSLTLKTLSGVPSSLITVDCQHLWSHLCLCVNGPVAQSLGPPALR